MLTHVFQAKNLTFKGQFVHILCFFYSSPFKIISNHVKRGSWLLGVNDTAEFFAHSNISAIPIETILYVKILQHINNKTKMLNSMNKKMNNFIKTKILNSMKKKNNFIKKMLNSIDKNMQNFIKGRCCTILKNVEHSLTWGFQFCYCEGGVF